MLFRHLRMGEEKAKGFSFLGLDAGGRGLQRDLLLSRVEALAARGIPGACRPSGAP